MAIMIPQGGGGKDESAFFAPITIKHDSSIITKEGGLTGDNSCLILNNYLDIDDLESTKWMMCIAGDNQYYGSFIEVTVVKDFISEPKIDTWIVEKAAGSLAGYRLFQYCDGFFNTANGVLFNVYAADTSNNITYTRVNMMVDSPSVISGTLTIPGISYLRLNNAKGYRNCVYIEKTDDLYGTGNYRNNGDKVYVIKIHGLGTLNTTPTFTIIYEGTSYSTGLGAPCSVTYKKSNNIYFCYDNGEGEGNMYIVNTKTDTVQTQTIGSGVYGGNISSFNSYVNGSAYAGEHGYIHKKGIYFRQILGVPYLMKYTFDSNGVINGTEVSDNLLPAYGIFTESTNAGIWRVNGENCYTIFYMGGPDSYSRKQYNYHHICFTT